jgi:hypothetical protein
VPAIPQRRRGGLDLAAMGEDKRAGALPAAAVAERRVAAGLPSPLAALAVGPTLIEGLLAPGGGAAAGLRRA